VDLKLNGCYRIVLLIGKYAIKIANFKGRHLDFLLGCYNNYKERSYYKQTADIRVAKSYFCSWFGLIQIQKRYNMLERDLTNQEIESFSDVHFGDYKRENFGLENNQLKCLDYSMSELSYLHIEFVNIDDINEPEEKPLGENEYYSHDLPEGYELDETNDSDGL
jgi:hypothetical protein